MMSNTIFLIDDDDIFRSAATVLLSQELPGFETAQFENGLEAHNTLMELSETPEKLPDVILLDINMPVMNGWEFLEELKSSPRQIREQPQIFILTSSIAPEDLNLSKTYEFIDGYIRKPLTTEDLKQIATTIT